MGKNVSLNHLHLVCIHVHNEIIVVERTFELVYNNMSHQMSQVQHSKPLGGVMPIERWCVNFLSLK